jgi:hypothetical protein
VRAPLTPQSDRARPIPAAPGARRDAIAAALRSLRHERRRLERLGFELPLARCHEETRYWSFVQAIDALPSEGEARP